MPDVVLFALLIIVNPIFPFLNLIILCSGSSMAVCGGCAAGYYRTIVSYFEKNDAAREVLRRHGVLPATVTCPRCHQACKLSGDTVWRCSSSHVVPKTRKRRFCGFSVSDNKGTFLDHSRLPPWKIVLFVNHHKVR